jgi:hypothetical protein
MNIIVMGNPVEGLTFVGPFDDPNEAGDYAADEYRNEEWWIAYVHPPKDES